MSWQKPKGLGTLPSRMEPVAVVKNGHYILVR